VHHRLLSRAGILTLIGWACSACSGEGGEPLHRSAEKIIGGQHTGYDHAGVLYVTTEIGSLGGNVFVKAGSGSLIAPNLVATALHVVSKNPSNIPFTCDESGNEISGSEGSALGATVEPAKVAVYAGPIPGSEPLARGTRIVSTGSKTLCENDLAFIVLDTPLDLPTYEVRRPEVVRVGDSVTVVGYGTPPDMEVIARTEREVDVSAVGQWIRTFTVTAGPCEGDSGGPALDEQGRLVGVFSSVASDCTGSASAAKYTDLSYFGSLIEDAFESAGAGSAWGSGGAGGQPSEPEPDPSDGGGEPSGAAGSPAVDPDPEPPPRDAPSDSGCRSSTERASGGGVSGLLVLLGAAISLRRVRRRRCR
jgi:Trypsin-like peptidase domain